MPDNQELKPCPFCGNDNIEIRSNGIGDYYAICSGDGEEGDPCGCGASTSDRRCESQKGAIDRWNTRVPDTELIEAAEELVKEVSGSFNDDDFFDDDFFGLRGSIGNTNYNCILNRCKALEAAIVKSKV